MAKKKQTKTPDALFRFRCPICVTSEIVIEAPIIQCPSCDKRFGWKSMLHLPNALTELRPDERKKFEAECQAEALEDMAREIRERVARKPCGS